MSECVLEDQKIGKKSTHVLIKIPTVIISVRHDQPFRIQSKGFEFAEELAILGLWHYGGYRLLGNPEYDRKYLDEY